MISTTQSELCPAGIAFDAIADQFDERFGGWQSVAAQRRAVYAELLTAFPEGARLVEIGGGTGIDAAWLTARGRPVFLTDASPAMVRVAARKIGEDAVATVAAEHLDRLVAPGEQFDGAFSNFAALNCVIDLEPVGAQLARLVRPGGRVALVMFGCCAPGEMLTQAVRRRWRSMFRRLRRGATPARLSGRVFHVRYHRGGDIEMALAPWFRPIGRRAIGLFVPPSDAEPWISRHPRLLEQLEAMDRRLSRLFAPFGDHVLYLFERRCEGEAGR